MRQSKEFKQWRKERDEAIYTLDVDTFKKFYRKWQKRGVYTEPLPSDEVIEIFMRKMVCCLADIEFEDLSYEDIKNIAEHGKARQRNDGRFDIEKTD